MGTEIFIIFKTVFVIANTYVKLNDPLMGTEISSVLHDYYKI